MSNGDSQPSALRFSMVLRRLVGRRDSQGIIRLVERWLEHGSVPQTARVMQAKAFMDLRLMDHAWVRLREAAKSEPGSVVVQLILAEMFVERGWPGKAIPLLDRINLAEADDDQRVEWSRLRTEASRPAKVPPTNAADIERSGTAEEVLALAEIYLSTGSFVRAESLLERLVRDGVDNPRIRPLLWAVQGDFSGCGSSSNDLLTELAGDEGSPEIVNIELTDSFVVDETAHIEPSEAGMTGLAEATRRGFPKLFRRDENTGETTAGTAGEVTASSRAIDDVEAVFDDGSTDPEGTPFPGAGDTRIMQVISHGDGVILQAVDGTIHRTTGDRSKVDLKSHRETYLPPDDETFLEDEDKDLIVMTRREDRPVPSPAPPLPQTGDALVSEEPSVNETDQLTSHPPEEGGDEEVSEVEFDEASPRGIPWSIAFGAVGVTAFIAWMVFAVLHWIAQGQIIQETHQVVAAADFRSLQELEARLEAQVEDDRSPIAVRVAELALVRAILWADYTGDSTRMALAQDGLDAARALGAPSQELALISGYLALAMGDLPTAREWLDDIDSGDPLSRDLTARIALRVRDDEESRALLAGIGQSAEEAPLLELLSRESLLTELGDKQEAKGMRARLLRDHPNNPFVQIQRFQEQWDDSEGADVLASLDDVMESLPGPVSARQEGRLHALRASLLMERGEYEAAERSWSSALVVDPTNPRYLHHAAAVRLSNNQILAALDDLDRCLGARPWDQNCRQGKIQALIELDRITHARQAIDAWGDVRTTVLRAWVQQAGNEPEIAIATLEGEDGALASWVRGMALLDLGSSKASVALEPAIEGWSGVSQPMTRILVGRAKTAQVVAKGDLDAMTAAVNRWADRDPVALVMVAKRLDAAGQRVSAEQLFQRATEVGPESAVALHALGMFWFDPRSSLDSARSVWRQYLDLQPSGDRARRTRARMGRR